MSAALEGKVGSKAIRWRRAPQGSVGEGEVQVGGSEWIKIRWKKDTHGVWVEFPNGTFGFDIEGTTSDDEKLSFRVSERGSHMQWHGLHFARAGESDVDQAASGKKKKFKVKAQMPGKIVRVDVKADQAVHKGQTLLIMEAMKMENEIKSAADGKVITLTVKEGDTVETGAELMVIE